MPQAKITINSVPGSNANLPINTLVALDNQNVGGELTFTWSILDQPPGAVDSLSSVSAQNPFFTPKKEGTYLIRLIVNQSLPTEQEDRVIAAVVQLKTLERIPAAGETTEGDTSDGWATSQNSYLRRIDTLLVDPGVIVGVNTSGGTLTRGQVVRSTTTAVIKATLPGAETLPGFSLAHANVLAEIDELLAVVEGTPSGGASVPGVGAADLRLMKVRYIGRLSAQVIANGPISAGDIVHVNDAGALDRLQGTLRRRVGSAQDSAAFPLPGSTADVWFNGVGGAEIDLTPINTPFVVWGPNVLPNSRRIDGTNAQGITGSSWRFRAGDALVGTIALEAQAFAGSAQDVFRTLDSAGGLFVTVSFNGTLFCAGTSPGLAVISPGGNVSISNGGSFVNSSSGNFLHSGTGGFVANIGSAGFVANGGGFTVNNSGGVNVNAGGVNVNSGGGGITVAAGGGNFTFGASNQKVLWPSSVAVTSAGANEIQFQLNAGGDIAEFFSIPGAFAHMLLAGPGLVNGLLRVTPTAVELRTTSAASIDFQTSSTTRWRVAAGGTLTSVGGPRLISGVADPVSAQDAATKNYTDANINAGRTLHNNIINGRFDWWQRGTSFVVAGTYTADRWAFATGGGWGTPTLSRATDTTQPWRFMARITRPIADPASFGVAEFWQEIDRDFVKSLRGKDITVVLKARRGAGVQTGGFAGFVVAVFSGTGAEEETIYGGYTGAVSVCQTPGFPAVAPSYSTIVGVGTVPTNATTLGLTIEWGLDGTVGVANEFIDVAEVCFYIGTTGPFHFVHSSGSLTADWLNCLRYYEKSYPPATDPGSGGTSTYFSGTTAAILTANGNPWPFGAQPRFKVTKWKVPTVTVYSNEPAVNRWSVDNTYKNSLAGFVTTEAFQIVNNTGGNSTPVASAGSAGGWTAQAEIGV